MFRLKFIKANRAQNFHSFVPQNSILPLPQSAGATAHDQRTSGWSSDTGPCFCLALCGALHHCGLCNDYHLPWCRLGSPRWLKKPLQARGGRVPWADDLKAIGVACRTGLFCEIRRAHEGPQAWNIPWHTHAHVELRRSVPSTMFTAFRCYSGECISEDGLPVALLLADEPLVIPRPRCHDIKSLWCSWHPWGILDILGPVP